MLSVHPQQIVGYSGQEFSIFVYLSGIETSDVIVSCLSGDVLVATVSDSSLTIPAGIIGIETQVMLHNTGSANIYVDGGIYGSAISSVSVNSVPGLIEVSVPDIVSTIVTAG